MGKTRQSNIELCRIASIILVMLVHTTQQSLGADMSLGALLLEGFTIVGVNVFILITGYFSATPKKTSLINLAFICLFWMIVKVLCRYEFGEPITYYHLFFVTYSNWFIPSYIALLFLTPILNLFCNTMSKRVLWGGVISLVCIEVWFDLIPPIPVVSLGSQRGYSVFSFMILYLLARAIRLYGVPQWFKKNSFMIYTICSIVLGCSAFFLQKIGHGDATSIAYAYSNPIVILSSVAFFMMFENKSFNSKFINHMAKSTLAILFGHGAIFFLYTKQFKYLYDNYDGFQVVAYWALAIALVFVASIIMDQLRLLLWKPINNYLKIHIKNDNIF